MVTHPDKVHVRINGLCSNGVEWWLIFEKNGNIWSFLIDIDFPLSCGGAVPFSCWILYLSQCLSSFKFCQIMGIFPCLDKDSLQTIRLGFGIIGKKKGGLEIWKEADTRKMRWAWQPESSHYFKCDFFCNMDLFMFAPNYMIILPE